MEEKESISTNAEDEATTSLDDSLAGIQLKTKREELDMTIDEVASKLNLYIKYITSIETNDFSKISSTSYVYGYVRSYAKLLKLPEQEILDLYGKDKGETAQLLPDYMGQRKIFSDEKKESTAWVLLVVVVTSLLFLTWWFIRQ